MSLHQPLSDRYEEYCASLLQLFYSRWIPKGKNGRLWVRFEQECLGKQRKLITMSPWIVLHLFLCLKIFYIDTYFHQQSGSFHSHILKTRRVSKWKKAMLEEFKVSFHLSKLLISCHCFCSRYSLPHLCKNRVNIIYNSLVKKMEYKYKGRKMAKVSPNLRLSTNWWVCLLTTLSDLSFMNWHAIAPTNVSQSKFYPRIIFGFC